jgi:hypothetical protein
MLPLDAAVTILDSSFLLKKEISCHEHFFFTLNEVTNITFLPDFFVILNLDTVALTTNLLMGVIYKLQRASMSPAVSYVRLGWKLLTAMHHRDYYTSAFITIEKGSIMHAPALVIAALGSNVVLKMC